MNSIERGLHAETLVAQSLEKKGYRVIERNYKKHYGEIDLIALKDELLVFIEVKMRTNPYFDCAQVITQAKQQRIINVASHYISHKNFDDKDCRFDVALVEVHNQEPAITYITGAFTAS